MSTPHPEFETLAELADQAGDAPEPATGTQPTAATASHPTAATADHTAAATAEVLAHVADCATCQANLDALRSVRATLRSLPPIPMPAEVAARLDAAILAARAEDAPGAATSTAGTAAADAETVDAEPADFDTADVVPIKTRSARPAQRNPFPYSAAAAVVAVLALGGGLVFAITKGGGDSKKSASTAAASSSSGPRLIASGTDYTAESLRQQVATLVTGTVPDAAAVYPGVTNPNVLSLDGAPAAGASASAPAAAAASSAAASTSAAPAASPSGTTFDAGSGAARAPVAPAPTRTAPTGPLADPAALKACITTLLGKYEEPVLVDYANYNGVPSTILVLPDPDVGNKLDIYVEADTANCAKEDITAVAFLPASAAP